MELLSTYQPYPSHRYPVYAKGGMVATSSPQASSAGLEMLRQGGNAVDAAIATATTLTVCEPTSNGIGSDAFALIWIEKDQKLYGLNASGFSPKNISIEAVKEQYKTQEMPALGWAPTMVPGAPAAWVTATQRFGKLPLSQIMEPAIQYAREGYPVAPYLSQMWQRNYKRYKALCPGGEFQAWFDTFAPEGRAPLAGEMMTLPHHANTLAEIAETQGKSFYGGSLAEKIVEDSQAFGGFFCLEDFSSYQPQWVEPISVHYRGYDVCEIPPNGQGIVALMALNMLKEFTFSHRDSVDTFHKQFEAIKIAFADGRHHVTDPRHMKLDYHDLIAPAYGAHRAQQITDQAATPCPELPPRSGTVYLCTADSEGNMVSYIQSNYGGFGSGIVVRDTGIALQNRGVEFSLDPQAANALAPSKKSYHTIIPGFLMQEGKAVGPFGVMGGYMQPQGHLQVAMNLIDFNLNPQQALDAPRWQWTEGTTFQVEQAFPTALIRELEQRGHNIQISLDTASFGRGQIILKGENGLLVGGTEGRTDSNIACY